MRPGQSFDAGHAAQPVPGADPLLAVPEGVNDLTPGPTEIFRISPLEGWRIVRSTAPAGFGRRGANSTGLNHHVLDGVAGLMIYRGDAYPAEFRGNLIVGDGQTNLVHRRLLVPQGVTFRSLRADENTEFMALDGYLVSSGEFVQRAGRLRLCDGHGPRGDRIGPCAVGRGESD